MMKLFEPITIRGMKLKNRIIMPAMGVSYGYTNKRVTNYFVERAKGGTSAILMGAGIANLFVSDDIWGKPGGVASFIERMKNLTRAVNEAGAMMGIQFVCWNRYPMGLGPDVGVPAGPSFRVEADPPSHAFCEAGDRLREFTDEEIADLIETHARAAAAAKAAGFNFVELHNAHGLMYTQFFSPSTNRRSDKYGGDAKKRMTFGIETMRAMRKAVGDDYPLWIRHGMYDVVEGGATTEECVDYALEMVKAGADVLDVSLATPPFKGGYVPGSDDPIGTHVKWAEILKKELVKKKIDIPVVACGRIKDPAYAEAVLAQGKADMIAIGRQLIADPFWTQKAKDGRANEIIPCIDCHECLTRSTVVGGNGVECTVNYSVGREKEAILIKAEKKKKVLVVGGGPAGMEAARVAAERGHAVTIQEKGNQLGGAMLLQAVIPHKEGVEDLAKYMMAQLDRAGVKVELRKETTPAEIAAMKPDVVVFATGAKSIDPDIKGIDGENVVSGNAVKALMSGNVDKKKDRIRSGLRGMLISTGGVLLNRPLNLTLRKQFAGLGIPIVFGKKTVIMGGDMAACQLAELLAEKSIAVTLVSKAEKLAEDMHITLRYRLMKRLKTQGIALITAVKKYERITKAGLVITNREGQQETIFADTIIPAVGQTPDDKMFQQMKKAAPEVYVIGDSAEPHKLFEAIKSGSQIGREI